MNAIKLLDNANSIRLLIDENMQELRMLNERKTGLPSSSVGNGGGSSAENRAAYIRAVEKIEKLERIILQDNARLAENMKDIELIINRIDRWDYRVILKKKYISNKSLNAIAEEMNRSEKTIQRNHKKAVAAFETAYKAMPKKFFKNVLECPL